jgi:hypothetical protein
MVEEETHGIPHQHTFQEYSSLKQIFRYCGLAILLSLAHTYNVQLWTGGTVAHLHWDPKNALGSRTSPAAADRYINMME